MTRCAAELQRAAPFDVLVIGAGPAGSAAAIELARGGARVAVVERRCFPRDKTCGDALIPDAIAVLDHLSLSGAVLSRARVVDGIRVYAPNGRFVTVRGRCACVPRILLDEILRAEALRAGAACFHGYRLKAPIIREESGRRDECGMRGNRKNTGSVIRGAVFENSRREVLHVHADTTILATGAAAEALLAFEVCERVSPSAIAARMYVTVDGELARTFDYLCISYDKVICPGYGWLFPGPDDSFNVGVGYFYDARHPPPETNVRRLFDRFISAFGPARELMKQSRTRGTLKGAPIRTAFAGAKLGRPGLLLAGEAAGLTYSFSGEGIGKAMASGVIAARTILAQHANGQPSPHAVTESYSTSLREAFGPRFQAYKSAQDWLSRPTIVNLLTWQANRSRFARQQLEGLFQETVGPGQLFSVAGFLRALIS